MPGGRTNEFSGSPATVRPVGQHLHSPAKRHSDTRWHPAVHRTDANRQAACIHTRSHGICYGARGRRENNHEPPLCKNLQLNWTPIQDVWNHGRSPKLGPVHDRGQSRPLLTHFLQGATRFDSRRQQLQRLQGIIPTQTGIGDTFAVFERRCIIFSGREFLCTGVQMALHHHTEYAVRA